MTNPPRAPSTLQWRWTHGLALIGGNVFGLMFDWEALYPALTHHPFVYGQHGPLSELGSVLGNFVLPIAVTSIAPRRSFLWAAATLGIGLAWSLMDRVVALNGPGLIHDLMDNGGDAFWSLLILCGPISLVRLLIRRSRDAKAKRIAEQQAWMEHSIDPTGVWPPPIRVDGHSEDKPQL